MNTAVTAVATAPATAAPVVVIDFETTGMSPERGERITEVGAVLVEHGRIAARFQSLANAGVPVPPFIRQLTGISNAMLAAAPPVDEVMAALAAFVGTHTLVAHNASFDRRFLDAELARIGRTRTQPMLCTVQLSRRLVRDAPSHSLGPLVRWLDLPDSGVHHRALADAEMTAHLWLHLHEVLDSRYGLRPVTHALLHALIDRAPKQADAWLRTPAAGALAAGRTG